MTSNINFSSIDENYPVAGKDNDSQGFRDNFNQIKTGLATAKSEITTLQSKSILNQAIDTTDPINNDLKGSSINNGYYNNFHGKSRVATVNGTANIDVSAASIHVLTLLGSTTFTFTNWPNDTYYAKLKVHFCTGDNAIHTVSLFSANGGQIKKDDQFPSSFTVPDNGKHQVIEVWSWNRGATVYVKYLGSF